LSPQRCDRCSEVVNVVQPTVNFFPQRPKRCARDPDAVRPKAGSRQRERRACIVALESEPLKPAQRLRPLRLLRPLPRSMTAAPLKRRTRRPVADAAFDYISAQFCLHHMPDKARVLSEARRVLSPVGCFAIVDMDPWEMEDWDIYQYFPEARRVDHDDFLPIPRLEQQLLRAGFGNVELRRQTHRFTSTLQQRFELLRKRFTPSQLLAISDDAFERGIARMAEHAAADGSREHITRIEVASVIARP
jgi:SAM-dependent methyltransferase